MSEIPKQPVANVIRITECGPDGGPVSPLILLAGAVVGLAVSIAFWSSVHAVRVATPAPQAAPVLIPIHEFRASLVRVIDGDTVELYVDRGHGDYSTRIVRLLGIDCPERGTPEGQQATQFTREWFSTARGLNPEWPVALRSDKQDSFGRWLVTIEDTRGRSLRDDLAAAGHVKQVAAEVSDGRD